MGVGIYPVFQPPVEEAVFDCDGKLLARWFEKLDAIAAENGLPAFSSFGDNRLVPEGFDGDPDELNALLGSYDEWFPIEEGLRAVEGLISAINAKTGTAKTLRQDDDIVGELRELANCLQKAGKKSASFRLEMG
jgi:hypothetical protein